MITERQRQQRVEGIGASEVGAILGLDPFRSAYDLWALKTGKCEESENREESEAVKIGNLIEPTVAALAEERLGVKLVKPTATYKHPNGIMFANLDRQMRRAERGALPVELKSTGIVDGWGEDGSDVVPDRVLLQVTAQMMCSGATAAKVARLLGRFGLSFSMYHVNLDADLAQTIDERVCQFWEKNVQRDIPPENSFPSVGVVSHFRREPGKEVVIDDLLVAEFVRLRDARKAAEQMEEEAKALLLAGLGDAEIGVTASGYKASFKTISSQRLDADRARDEHPEFPWDQYMRASSYRRLDVRAAKSKKEVNP